MDKYLIVILILMITGMGISIVRDPPLIFMFYTMLGGAIAVILYAAIKQRKDIQRERRKRRHRK